MSKRKLVFGGLIVVLVAVVVAGYFVFTSSDEIEDDEAIRIKLTKVLETCDEQSKKMAEGYISSDTRDYNKGLANEVLSTCAFRESDLEATKQYAEESLEFYKQANATIEIRNMEEFSESLKLFENKTEENENYEII